MIGFLLNLSRKIGENKNLKLPKMGSQTPSTPARWGHRKEATECRLERLGRQEGCLALPG